MKCRKYLVDGSNRIPYNVSNRKILFLSREAEGLAR
jgi:hypothetical protein